MKQRLRKVLGVSMAIMLAAGLTVSPAMADEAQAAPKKPYMKTLKLKWNLKKNKAMKFTSRFVSVGKKPMTMTIKNVKVSKAKKKGYKKLTFTVVNKAAWKPTKKQVHKMVKSRLCRETGSVGGYHWWTVADYDTGLCLEGLNKLGVTVKSAKKTSTKRIKDNDGCSVFFRDGVTKVTVTYPEDYKGLCIGVGGHNIVEGTKADDLFFEGKRAFGKTSYYKHGKTNSHWMRIK